MSDFNVGDVVELKSGSVPMTITSNQYEDEIECYYWDGKQFEHLTLVSGALKKSQSLSPHQSFTLKNL